MVATRISCALIGSLPLTGHAIASGLVVALLSGCFPADAATPGELAECSAFQNRSSWLSPDWAYRIRFAVIPDSIDGPASFLDFPVLLPLNGSELPEVFEHAKNDGSDLVITRADGTTLLDREIVSYDSTDQRAELWFRADSLSAVVNSFYMYYGNADTSLASDDSDVWSRPYLGVYHFSENPGLGILKDWGENSNDAQALNGWTQSDTIGGAIGCAWRFNGTSHWVDADAMQCADSTFTVSAWFADWDQQNGEADFALQVGVGYWNLSVKRNTTQRRPDYYGSASFISWYPDPLPDESLHHFVWVLDGDADTARFFFDGREQAVRARYAPHPPYKAYTGEQILGNVGLASPIYGNTDDRFHGIADEFRVFADVRSANWIRTEYRNQKWGLDFFLFDTEEVAGTGPVIPEIVGNLTLQIQPNPSQGGISVVLGHAGEKGRLEVIDIMGRLVRTIEFSPTQGKGVHLRWDGRDEQGRDMNAGLYLLRAKAGGSSQSAKAMLLR